MKAPKTNFRGSTELFLTSCQVDKFSKVCFFVSFGRHNLDRFCRKASFEILFKLFTLSRRHRLEIFHKCNINSNNPPFEQIFASRNNLGLLHHLPTNLLRIAKKSAFQSARGLSQGEGNKAIRIMIKALSANALRYCCS